MDREQQPVTIIDLDDRRSRRSGVVTAIVVVLLTALAVAPFVLEDVTSPAEAPRVTMQGAAPASPALCRPAFDVPSLLDPVAKVVLPGWARLCGWLSQPAVAEPFDPSG